MDEKAAEDYAASPEQDGSFVDDHFVVIGAVEALGRDVNIISARTPGVVPHAPLSAATSRAVWVAQLPPIDVGAQRHFEGHYMAPVPDPETSSPHSGLQARDSDIKLTSSTLRPSPATPAPTGWLPEPVVGERAEQDGPVYVPPFVTGLAHTTPDKVSALPEGSADLVFEVRQADNGPPISFLCLSAPPMRFGSCRTPAGASASQLVTLELVNSSPLDTGSASSTTPPFKSIAPPPPGFPSPPTPRRGNATSALASPPRRPGKSARKTIHYSGLCFSENNVPIVTTSVFIIFHVRSQCRTKCPPLRSLMYRVLGSVTFPHSGIRSLGDFRKEGTAKATSMHRQATDLTGR